MSITLFTPQNQKSFKTIGGMKLLESNNNEVSAEVKTQKEVYYQIDLTTTMGQIKKIGDMFRLVYAATVKTKCKPAVSDILSKFLVLLNDTEIATHKFVAHSTNAMELHQEAYGMAKRKIYPLALLQLELVSKKAAEMSKIAEALVNQTKGLCDLTERTLNSAAEVETSERTNKREIIASREKNERRQSELEALQASLRDEISDQTVRENESKKKANTESTQGFALKVAKEVVSPLVQAVTTIAAAVISTKIPGTSIPTTTPQTQSTSSTSTTSLSSEETCRTSIEARLKEVVKLKDDVCKKEAEITTAEKAPAKDAAKIKEDVANKEAELKAAEEAEAKDESKINKLREELKALKVEQAAADEAIAKINKLKEELKTLKASLDTAEKTLADLRQNLNEIIKQHFKTVNTYLAMQSLAAKRKTKLMEEQRKVNAELAGALKAISQQSTSESNIQSGIEALQLAQGALRKVQLSFEELRTFWVLVEFHTKELISSDEKFPMYAKFDLSEDLMNAINQSAFGWMTIGLTCQAAYEAIVPARKHFCTIYGSLPITDDAAVSITKSQIAIDLHNELVKENATIDSTKAKEKETEKEKATIDSTPTNKE